MQTSYSGHFIAVICQSLSLLPDAGLRCWQFSAFDKGIYGTIELLRKFHMQRVSSSLKYHPFTARHMFCHIVITCFLVNDMGTALDQKERNVNGGKNSSVIQRQP